MIAKIANDARKSAGKERRRVRVSEFKCWESTCWSEILIVFSLMEGPKI